MSQEAFFPRYICIFCVNDKCYLRSYFYRFFKLWSIQDNSIVIFCVFRMKNSDKKQTFYILRWNIINKKSDG